MSSTVKSLIN